MASRLGHEGGGRWIPNAGQPTTSKPWLAGPSANRAWKSLSLPIIHPPILLFPGEICPDLLLTERLIRSISDAKSSSAFRPYLLAPAPAPFSSPSFAGFRAGMRHQSAHQQYARTLANNKQESAREKKNHRSGHGRASQPCNLQNARRSRTGRWVLIKPRNSTRARIRKMRAPPYSPAEKESGRGIEKCVCLRCAAAVRPDAKVRPIGFHCRGAHDLPQKKEVAR